MRGVRTHGAASLAAGLHEAKPGVSQPAVGDGFKSRWQSALSTPVAGAGLAQRHAAAKAQALKEGDAADEAGAARASAAAKKIGAANEAAQKAKTKQSSKPGDETSSVADAKTAAGADAGGVVVNGLPGNVQPVQVAKKDFADANGPAINSATNSASTSTLQQAALPADLATGPVGIATAKQMDATALESKTKRVSASSIASLSEKAPAGVVGSDGLPTTLEANGISVGGVGGSGLQGGHSSGTAGHGGQQAAPSQAAAAGPQVMASSPSQLDVGVYDDTHGWLRIRAELGAGGAVNATLTSADAAHESLKTALPEMTHYLGTEAVHVNSIALDKFGDAGGGQPGSHAEAQQQGSMGGRHAGGEQQHGGAQSSAIAMLDDAVNRTVVPVVDEGGVTEVEAVTGITAVAATSVEPVGEAGIGPAVAETSELVGDRQMPDGLGGQVLPWQVGYGGSGGWVNVSA